MIPLNDPSFGSTVDFLKKYDPNSAIPKIAGLLTVPELQANTIRIETLVHLAVVHCQGKSDLRSPDIRKLLNNHLGRTQIADHEDPPEDVFVTNVETPKGNFLLFQSVWESNDYFAQTVIDLLHNSGAPPKCKELITPIYSLLTLSDCLAKHACLQRWISTPSESKGIVKLPKANQILKRAEDVTFSATDLSALGIERNSLEPFILNGQDRQNLNSETIGNSSLEQRPLVELNDELVLALPHAISPAIRRFVLGKLRESGLTQEFSLALAKHQALQVTDTGLQELRGNAESLEPIPPVGDVPSCHTWLLKYDTDKYIHIVLLHDHMDRLYRHGLGSFLEYTNEEEENLQGYLYNVSQECSSFPDFAEGITIVIFGGLGRGIKMRTPELSNRWSYSFLSIPDLIMLANYARDSVRSYLKFVTYKKWAEGKGIVFLNINGDFNLYCFWLRNKYRLVPEESPIAPGSVIYPGIDLVQTIRKEIRTTVDRHLLQTIDGVYVPVVRLNKDSLFPSLDTRPVYVRLFCASKGQLAGAVKTSLGSSWLLMTAPRDPEIGPPFAFPIWNGFIELYARLIFEFEADYLKVPSGEIAVHLNFEGVTSSWDVSETRTIDPTITTDLKKRIAHIRFPDDMLRHFQQAENVGEKMVVQRMTKALMYLYRGGQDAIDENHVTEITNRVIGNSGIRIVHGFQPRNYVERLQMRHSTRCIDLDKGSFNLNRLLLSEGCGGTTSTGQIESKVVCNEFLNCLVDKVSKRLQGKLHSLDRSHLICKVYGLYEACLWDREHWSRTGNAMLSLYGETDDVRGIMGRKEKDRNNVSMAIRTVMEMAICECPASGGKRVSNWGVDDLLADATLLNQIAMDSDAIRNGFLDPRLELQVNGEYTVNRDIYQTVIESFIADYREMELKDAARRYTELYQNEPASDDRTRHDLWSDEFVPAFQNEFGLTPEDVRECLAELVEMATELDSVIVETTLGDIRKRFAKRGGITPHACEAFMNTFGNFHRPVWEKPPTGFKKKDIYPWRFNRRLSATAKPIFIFGQQNNDQVIFGIGALSIGCAYILYRTEDGRLPIDFYTSQEMKRYVGEINNQRGHSFARSVACEMQKRGWDAKNEVKMSSLGAPAELGDVDVLAWRSDGNIQIIECKRLKLAKTVTEISEICRRFRGDARDGLDRHVQRVQWIKTNPACLQQIVGYLPEPDSIDDRFVTSNHVPMKYLKSLPIDPVKIGPLE